MAFENKKSKKHNSSESGIKNKTKSASAQSYLARRNWYTMCNIYIILRLECAHIPSMYKIILIKFTLLYKKHNYDGQAFHNKKIPFRAKSSSSSSKV